MRKRRQKLILVSLLVILLFMGIIVLVEVVQIFTTTRASIAYGLEILESAANADMAAIENRIQRIEERDRLERYGIEGERVEERSMREIFSTSVIMGDSIAEAFSAYNILHGSSVVAGLGARLDAVEGDIARVVEISPQFLFLSYGRNDIIMTGGDIELFLAYYEALLNRLHLELPGTRIFVNAIFPVHPEVVEANPVLAYIEDYNQALRQLCEQRQVTFIDHSSWVEQDYFAEDGIHFQFQFYMMWLNRMREVAALW